MSDWQSYKPSGTAEALSSLMNAHQQAEKDATCAYESMSALSKRFTKKPTQANRDAYVAAKRKWNQALEKRDDLSMKIRAEECYE